MIKKTFHIAIVGLLLIGSGISNTMAQDKLNISIPIKSNGSFNKRLSQLKLNAHSFPNNLNEILGLDSDNDFIFVKEKLDINGFLHATFNQTYKGIRVEDAMVKIHSKGGWVTSINGQILSNKGEIINVNPSVNSDKAIQLANEYLGVLQQSNSKTPELVVIRINDQNELAYKVRVIGLAKDNKWIQSDVYIHAHKGTLLDTRQLIHNVEAVASTFYSGEREILTELMDDGRYKLRDNERNIETYNASGLTPNSTGAILYDDPHEIVNLTTTWEESPYLMSMSLQNSVNEELTSGLGLSFSTLSGNVFSSTIERSIDSEVISRNNEISSTIEIPYTAGNLFVPIYADETYIGRFFKDSVYYDFSTGELASGGVHEASAISFEINESTEGTHPWTDAVGNSGNYVIEYNTNPALDVHWGISKTYDFFKDKFDYISYDDEGSVIRNYYDGVFMLAGTQNNAAALPAPQNAMVYGTGDGVSFNPFVTLDVTAHEFTHLIMGNTANLTYSGESGALNEAFSDIMGTAIEFYAKGSDANWTIGEDLCITIPYMRSMSNPNAPAGFDSDFAIAQPDTYKGNYWASTGASDPDNGGVHINSGVANYWYYLMVEGGAGTNDKGFGYSVSPLGIEKANQIVFSTFTNYLTSASDFHDAYEQSLTVAAELYGESSSEYNTVESAWNAVGIPENLSISYNGNVEDKYFSIYPNPTSNQLNVKSLKQKMISIEIVDVLGSTIMDLNCNAYSLDLNLEKIVSGNYILKAKFENGTTSSIKFSKI